jgi:serine protease
MEIRQTQNGRIATQDSRPTACIGVSRDADWPQAIEAAVPEGAEVLHADATLGYAHVALPTDDLRAADRMVADMDADDGVEYAEWTPVYEHPSAGEADESRFSGVLNAVQPALRGVSDAARRLRSAFRDGEGDPRAGEQYAPGRVNAPKARAMLPDDPDVSPRFTVIDTGVDYLHPDLRDQFGDDTGYDFGADDDDPRPEVGLVTDHGSHVGGIATATIGNGEGVEGIAGTPDVQLLSARIFGGDPTAIGPTVAEAIRWAADNDADVANMSIGGNGRFGFPSETVRRATEYATDNGTLLVAATGNAGENTVSYPAAHPEVLAVGATGPEGNVAEFSNGGDRIDVVAPGVGVLSTTPPWRSLLSLGDFYAEKSGTSMASPAAAGVALLGVLAGEGEIGPRELRKAIERTAEPLPDTPTERQGEGEVRADALVRSLRDREE